MKVVIDVEANSLNRPTKIWLIICKDIADNSYSIFRNVSLDDKEKERFLAYASNVSLFIGHNLLGYDIPALNDCLGCDLCPDATRSLDTLIVSKLVDYPRQGHSIADYGEEFGIPKGKFNDFTKYSTEMEEYCIRDVDITHKVYLKYLKYISNKEHLRSIEVEHKFQLVVNALHTNGFSINVPKANKLLTKVTSELAILDKDILEYFPPKLRLVREVTPKVTKHGTLNKADFRFVKDGDLSIYNGGPFSRCAWIDFNPSSHKQIVGVLNNAGWSPVDKTQTHIDLEREVQHLKYTKHRTVELDLRIQECNNKILDLRKTGWKINENNLGTLPPSAPSPARTLAQRILLESRRRTLTEWLGLVHPDTGRIHGRFYGIGAWTQRMAHREPNTANIPTEAKLYGHEMRALWQAPKNRLLVGVDAEGIQLRIFAHYIDDPEFTRALVEGKKHDKTDPHSLNQRVIGSSCKSRSTAKRFIYALLLGAGINKLSEILECGTEEAEEALSRLLERYSGFAKLKQETIPKDAKRGYFKGLDNRSVRIPGETEGLRRHLTMSGYLQNGEAVVMKHATLKWHHKLKQEGSLLVNMVHDEWQTETPNDMDVALRVAKMQSESIREVGEELRLKCPLAGSYWSEDSNDYTISTNWSKTH